MPHLRGVCVLDTPSKWHWVLRRSALTDIWGIAKRTARRLEDLNIYTAFDLANANHKEVRRRSNIHVARTVKELNGIPCLALDDIAIAKKNIYCSRSFGQKVTTLPPILEALSLYTARACEKLRQQRHLALTVHVFIHTSPHKTGFFSASDVVQLPYPTNDTRVITDTVRQLGQQLFQKGYTYLKAGVGLVEMMDEKYYQADLFHCGQSIKADKVMDIMDKINRK